MKTKDKILAIALRLFNERGISKVSSRTISEEMKISYGNLCYHYARKDDIILALYVNMEAEMNEKLENMKQEIFRFDFMVASLKQLMEVYYKYRFVYLGMTKVTREFEPIREHAKNLFEQNRKVLRTMAVFLTESGFWKYEHVKGHNEMLIHNLLLILNAWIADSELFYEGKEEDKIDYYLEMLYTCIRGSLTKKGLEAFNEVYKNKKRMV